MIKPRRPNWPIPGDTDLDKARTVARAYRERLAEVDPAGCAQLDSQFANLGQYWAVPHIVAVDLDGHLSATHLAEFIGVSPDTIYQWASRGHLTRLRDHRGRPVYSIRQAIDYHADLRRARIERQSRRSAS